MATLQQFLAMGGYAFYVWTAYGVAAALLIINVVTAVVHDKQIKRRLQKQMARLKP